MTKYLAIDPGTSNLGWVFGTVGEIEEASVDHIWTRAPKAPIREGLRQATITWFKAHRSWFEEADKVLVELQYTSSKTLGVFPPMVVMDTILTLCDFHFPGKARSVSASAVKKTFKISGDYDERKAQVVERAGLGHLVGRMHDIADCVVMMQYDHAQNAKAETALALAQAKEARRAKLREASPKRNSRHKIK